MLSPTRNPDAISTPRRRTLASTSAFPWASLSAARLATARSAEPADHASDGDRQRYFVRKVYADADGQGRQREPTFAPEPRLHSHKRDAESSADADHAPGKLMMNDAVRNLRHKRGLGCGHCVFRVHPRARQRPDKPVIGVKELKNRNDCYGPGDNANGERCLLLPGRGADHISSLEILKIVVRDRGDGYDDRRDEERQGHYGAALFTSAHRKDEAETGRDQDRAEDADA